MPLLYICSEESDYLQDLTYSGLVETIGSEQVVPYPYHWQYFRERRFLWSPKLQYPRNLGVHPRSDHKLYNEFQIRESIRKNYFQCVIVGSVKPDSLKTFVRLKEEFRVPWLLIDGGDWPGIGGDYKRLGGQACFDLFQSICKLSPPKLIFKREFLNSGNRDGNVFPFPFSIHSSKVPILEPKKSKKFQVIFWAVESSETRKEVFQLIKGKYDCEHNGSVRGQKFKKYPFQGIKYLQALNDSAVVLSFRGEGFDTLRYWEAPACGSLLISEKPLIEIPNNFSHLQSAVFCRNDLSDLISLIDYYLSHEKQSIQIAQAGQKHLLAHHTHIHRARYLIGLIEENLKIRFY